FNVGVTSQGDLIRLIEKERERGIFLSVLGVGRDNLKDSTMQKLADAGNGNYNYLDSLHEARRVLLAQAGATLVTVAKDVKLQVEFNPAAVAAYRLIGYEKRLLQKEDFNDDKKDAGEMGDGHSVAALYEIVQRRYRVSVSHLAGVLLVVVEIFLLQESLFVPDQPVGRDGGWIELDLKLDVLGDGDERRAGLREQHAP